MTKAYETFFVLYEHTTTKSGKVRINQSTITTCGVTRVKLREILTALPVMW